MGLSRRDLLASAGVATAAAAVGALTGAAPAFAAERDPARRRPNIVLILVDEMRYPMHFPAGVRTPSSGWRSSCRTCTGSGGAV